MQAKYLGLTAHSAPCWGWRRFPISHVQIDAREQGLCCPIVDVAVQLLHPAVGQGITEGQALQTQVVGAVHVARRVLGAGGFTVDEAGHVGHVARLLPTVQGNEESLARPVILSGARRAQSKDLPMCVLPACFWAMRTSTRRGVIPQPDEALCLNPMRCSTSI